ncbi:MAG TPA: hypothetical protein DCL61_12680 [Cyanobacteria bacterium UBA12227]|nr:hypothetical protein [Cyanobacteria bacterium UBA12227]HAX87190.1 hypothetical protein [Cyanobacteria bacterium UBA11370]HBY76134.1 hypothetical protein [Cyanobacteria bacterium UBA11148]
MVNSATAEVNAKGKANSRRTKKSQEVNMDKNNQTETTAIAVQEKTSETSTQGICFIEPSIPLPGNRPIATSMLKISDEVSIMGLRPVDASDLQVVGTISAMGERPIAASTMKVWDTLTLSGDRPIAASMIKISETEMIMGNRPIASNFIDNLEDLMGFLD